MRERPFCVAVLSLLCLVLLAERTALAFDPVGHDAIESVAYREILAMSTEVVRAKCRGVTPNAEVCAALSNGPTLFRSLVNRGYLAVPARRLGKVLPALGSGAVDDQLAYQLAEAGQCAHFMADSGDTHTDRTGLIPDGLVSDAYNRCIAHVHRLFDHTIADPKEAVLNNFGTYEIIHAVEDSFSTAHTHRNANGQIAYLKPWALRTAVKDAFSADDGTWALRESSASHSVKDSRDGHWIEADRTIADVDDLVGLGKSAPVLCSAFKDPDAVPAECLSAQGEAAKNAVVHLLFALAVAKADHPAENKAIWLAFQTAHLPADESVKIAETKPPSVFRPGSGWAAEYIVPRHGIAGDNTGHIGLSFTDFGYSPTLWPFVGAMQARVLYGNAEGHGSFVAQADVGGFVPLAGWLAVGTSPLGLSFDLADGKHTNRHYVRPYARLLDVRMFFWEGLMLRVGAYNLSWTEGVVKQPGYVEFGIGYSPRERTDRAQRRADWNGSIDAADRAYAGIHVTPRRVSKELTLDHSIGDGPSKQLLGGSAAVLFGNTARWERRAGYAAGLRFTPTYHQFAGDLHAWVMRGEAFVRANFFDWISFEAGLGVAGRTDPAQGRWAGDWNFQHVGYVAPRIDFGSLSLALRLGTNIETSGPQSGWRSDSITLRYGVAM